MTDTQQALMALKTLSEQIHEIEVRAEERLKAQHGRFNVFTTLLKASDEVRLHTRFIHVLLNSNGTHDCGDLFLELFFETLTAHPPIDHDDSITAEPWDDYSEKSYWVRKEVRIGGDQLDLLLESDSHLLVIENKIEAYEQPNQVERYINYLESQKAKIGQVLYLTLDGKQAETHNGKAYLRISYREHIMAWLERCLHATYDIVPINQVLIQYQKVVQQLIGKSADHQTMETIKDYIRKNPKIITGRESVNQGIIALRVEVRNNFADALMKALEDYIIMPRTDMRNNNFGEDPSGDLIIRPKENDFTAPHHDAFEIWIENVDARWHGLIIGIESGWKKKRQLTEDEETLLSKVRDKFVSHYTEKGDGFATDKVTWGGTYWPCSWHGLIFPFMEDDKAFAQMLDEAHFNSQVKQAADEVRFYFELLEKFYKEATE